MSNLFVLKFNDETSAQQVVGALKTMQAEHLISIDDAAIVTRKQDGKPKIKQAHDLVGDGALGGAFWGLLVGMLFFMPLIGTAIGAASGAIAGSMGDMGIDDKFIKQVSNSIQPGQSALFLLTHGAVIDKVVPELKKYKFEVIQTSLSSADEAKLREMVGVGAARA